MNLLISLKKSASSKLRMAYLLSFDTTDTTGQLPETDIMTDAGKNDKSLGGPNGKTECGALDRQTLPGQVKCGAFGAA